MAAKVLLVDGDKELGRLVDIVLHPIGIALYQAYSGPEGLRSAYSIRPDLVILGADLPEMDGFEVCARLREVASVPILMLSACTSQEDIVRGFGVGVNDFIQKPFNKNELEARVRALLRRSNRRVPGGCQVDFYNDAVLDIDLSKQTVKLRGEIVKLSPREYALLEHLVHVQGTLASYRELAESLGAEHKKDRTAFVAVYVFRLRKKLQDGRHGHQYIRTNWGRGYSFEARRQEAANIADHQELQSLI